MNDLSSTTISWELRKTIHYQPCVISKWLMIKHWLLTMSSNKSLAIINNHEQEQNFRGRWRNAIMCTIETPNTWIAYPQWCWPCYASATWVFWMYHWCLKPKRLRKSWVNCLWSACSKAAWILVPQSWYQPGVWALPHVETTDVDLCFSESPDVTDIELVNPMSIHVNPLLKISMHVFLPRTKAMPSASKCRLTRQHRRPCASHGWDAKDVGGWLELRPGGDSHDLLQ